MNLIKSFPLQRRWAVQDLCFVSGSQMMDLRALNCWCFGISLLSYGRANFWLHCRTGTIFIYSNGPTMEEIRESELIYYRKIPYHTLLCVFFFVPLSCCTQIRHDISKFRPFKRYDLGLLQRFSSRTQMFT